MGNSKNFESKAPKSLLNRFTRTLCVVTVLLTVAHSSFGQAYSTNGGPGTSQGLQIGGRGPDGKFHFALFGNDGSLTIGGTLSATTGGAAHQANGQVTASTTAGTMVIARATRVGCLIRNLDATITVYIGAATVTAGNGMPLKAGESVVVTAQTLIQVIAASGSPVVAYFDEYN